MTNTQTQIDTVGGNTKTPTIIRGRRWCITINNYTDTETQDTYNYITYNSHKWIIGKEKGKEGTPHLQAYFEFKNPKTFKQIKDNLPRAHIEKAKGNAKVNFDYCSKEGNYESKGFPQDKKKRVLEKYNNTTFYKWQQDIINIIEGPKNERTINWVYEEDGNAGKSFLSKYIYCKYDCIIGNGKMADVLNNVKCYLEENNDQDPNLIILDVPRVSLDYLNYSVLEKLKDGLVYSGKYEGGMILFADSPHIFVFANEEPLYFKMSADRWNVINIKKE